MHRRSRSYRWLVVGALAGDLACLADGRLAGLLLVLAVACVAVGAALFALGGTR